LRDHLNQSILNYYNFNLDSIEIVNFPTNPKILMEVNYIDQKVIEKNNTVIKREFIYELNSNNLGPFENSDKDIKDFLNSVREFKLNYTYTIYVPFYYSDNYECFNWKIYQIYNFAHRAHFESSLQITRHDCTGKYIKYLYIF
jgi:hypothetical protein